MPQSEPFYCLLNRKRDLGRSDGKRIAVRPCFGRIGFVLDVWGMINRAATMKELIVSVDEIRAKLIVGALIWGRFSKIDPRRN